MDGVIALALAKTYTDESISGAGGLKGDPCEISEITDITGGHRVTFSWTSKSGETQTQDMDVMNGEKGEKGDDGEAPTISISDITGGHRVTVVVGDYTDSFDVMDGSQGDPGIGIASGGTTGQVLKKKSGTDYDTEWADEPDIPTKTSDLTNDSNFVSDENYVHTDANYTAEEKTKLSGIESGAEANAIESIKVNGEAQVIENKTVSLSVITNLVDDLVNYYKKNETYTQAQVDSLIAAVSSLRMEKVDVLPEEDISTTTIYLLPKETAETDNHFDEYIYLYDEETETGEWEKIGDTIIDLTGYVTTEALNTTLANYVTSTVLQTTLADYVTNTALTSTLSSYVTTEALATALEGKQNTLTFDTTPKSGSANPVTSGGVYTAIQNKTIAVDSALSSTSTNPVQNKVINTALAAKANTSSLKTVATTGSFNDLTNRPQEASDIASIITPAPGTPSGASLLIYADTPRWLRFNPSNKKGLIIKANTFIRKSNGEYQKYFKDTTFDFTSSITASGTDYFVNLADDGTVSVSTSKLTTGVTIGRFHTLCANAGTMTMIVPVSPGSGLTTSSYIRVKGYDQTKDPDFYSFYNKKVTAVNADTTNYDVVTVDHPLSGFAAGSILPESVFCLTWHPQCLVEDAMVYDKDIDRAIDVYLQSGTGFNTRSKYNATHTVSRTAGNHAEDFRAVGKRLLRDYEFTSASLGSNQATNIKGSADATTVGGHSDTASRRMISAIGCEEMCGYLYQWLDELTYATQASEWANTDGRGLFGQEYWTPHVLLAGGSWATGSACGSRCRDSDRVRSTVLANRGGRGSSRVSRNAGE